MADEIIPQEKSGAENHIKIFKQLEAGRSSFSSFWQTLHDFFYVESPDISSMNAIGAELTSSYLYDATTVEAADVLASGFMNYLTPPTSKWFRLRSKNPRFAEKKTTNDFLEDVVDEVNHTLNTSNLYDQMLPAYKSSGVYGTSILLEEEDLEDEARFTNLPIKQVCIVEDARGRAKEFYIEFEYTAYQAMTRWGKDKLSKKMQEELEGRDPEKKHKFLLFIGQRSVRQIERTDSKNMPIQASWIDIEAKKTIDEGGYNEFPVMCHRFDKRPFIPWGYSPAMKSLPFARSLNAVTKTTLRSLMKHTDPPLALPDNAFIMPLNGNPRALNYYKKDSLGSNPANAMFAFGNYGNPEAGQWAIEYYTRAVKSIMYNDVFLAFDNITKQMNNPEVQERINEKMAMLGPAVGRWTNEVCKPIIIRTIGILARRGKLPDMPDELMDDPTFEIDYVSQLAQAQKRSELNSLNMGITAIAQMAQFAPEVLDKVDADKVVDATWSITGAPVRVLRADDEIQKIRENRQQQQAQAQDLMMAESVAKAGHSAAQADKAFAESKQVGAKK